MNYTMSLAMKPNYPHRLHPYRFSGGEGSDGPIKWPSGLFICNLGAEEAVPVRPRSHLDRQGQFSQVADAHRANLGRMATVRNKCLRARELSLRGHSGRSNSKGPYY